MVVETMEKEHLSIHATMQEFGINDHKIIERWERIYLEEGPEGLSVERRGRSSTGRSKKLPKEVEEDLLAEVRRLRAKNACLTTTIPALKTRPSPIPLRKTLSFWAEECMWTRISFR